VVDEGAQPGEEAVAPTRRASGVTLVGQCFDHVTGRRDQLVTLSVTEASLGGGQCLSQVHPSSARNADGLDRTLVAWPRRGPLGGIPCTIFSSTPRQLTALGVVSSQRNPT